MSIRTFVKELQNADERRKLRWLIGLTCLTVFTIVSIWLSVFRSQIIGTEDALIQKTNQPTLTQKIAITSNKVITTLRIKTANTINFFSKKASKTNTIEITTH